MYKVRATKRDDKGYDLSFGKGKKKVTAITKKDPSNGKWFVDVIGHYPKLTDLKKAWGEWAAEQYHGDSKADGETVGDQVPAPPSPPSLPPAPSTLPPPPPPAPGELIKPTSRRKPKGNGLVVKPPVGLEGLAKFASDPFDPQFRYPCDHPEVDKQKALTPLGMLLEVQAWHERYKDRVEAINHQIALTRIPGYNPFSFLRWMIDECIEQEIPKETTDAETNLHDQDPPPENTHGI